ncbi:polar amino acid transport system substrate-binding protein [Pseudoduganella flava]|uniref:Polar amino acid transport system substrate-binding protein n=1 Tax=Pseudoduganella flava TaxID=871742 RepID=A0A562PDB7_9BURK|nr:transporter substrate-binding domain-containing protein [Pseudoduganella flava]QGZ42194.1 transporter substrate-binding domain-containing protein [Pseudoduganella flava]TWI42421.1 polar amino acid transport system substrate-binding protein [Pseudoduganella flava]
MAVQGAAHRAAHSPGRAGRAIIAVALGVAGALSAALMAVMTAVPAQAAQVVTLCYERADVRPWRTEDGRGLNFELLKLAGERAGVTFDFQSMPFKRCLAQLKANAVDGAFAVSFKTDRREIGEYPGGATPDVAKRMHIDKYVLLRRKGSNVEWDGKALYNVDGAIGAQLGYSVTDVLRSLNVTVDEGSQRADELVRKLLAGRVAAAAVGGSDARTLLAGPYGPQIEALPRPLIEKPYFLLLSHQMVERRPELARRIWDAVEAARNSAAYRKLEKLEVPEAGKGKQP